MNARRPISRSERPAAAKNSGKSPHARPSFRLLTSPAWLALNSAGSVQLTRAKLRPHEVDLHDHGRGPREALVHAEQNVRRDDPRPARRPHHEEGNRGAD